jgi:hypothetical protein
LDVIEGVFTENGTHAMDYFTAEVHALDSSTRHLDGSDVSLAKSKTGDYG